jgi:hypothetical protein
MIPNRYPKRKIMEDLLQRLIPARCRSDVEKYTLNNSIPNDPAIRYEIRWSNGMNQYIAYFLYIVNDRKIKFCGNFYFKK